MKGVAGGVCNLSYTKTNLPKSIPLNHTVMDFTRHTKYKSPLCLCLESSDGLLDNAMEA